LIIEYNLPISKSQFATPNKYHKRDEHNVKVSKQMKRS